MWLGEQVKAFGWERIALSYSLTDSAREFMEVYRLPKPETLRDVQARAEGDVMTGALHS